MEKKPKQNSKNLAKMLKKEDWGNFVSSLNCSTPLIQAWNRVRQLRGKYKKINILQGIRAQYKDKKNIANKIGHTLAELFFP